MTEKFSIFNENDKLTDQKFYMKTNKNKHRKT